MSRLRYLLDTNIISELVRSPAGRITECIQNVGEHSVCTSVVVASELRYGSVKRNSERLTAQVAAVLSALTVLPLEPPADEHYGALRSYLEHRGMLIGPNDMLIAAHALTHSLTLVTANHDEFSRVPDLALENWLAQ